MQNSSISLSKRKYGYSTNKVDCPMFTLITILFIEYYYKCSLVDSTSCFLKYFSSYPDNSLRSLELHFLVIFVLYSSYIPIAHILVR